MFSWIGGHHRIGSVHILHDPPEAARALLLRRQLCPLRRTVP